MAVALTQIQDASTGIKSPQSLKPGGLNNHAQSSACDALLNSTAAVFEMSADMALDILSSNMDRLNALGADAPTNPNSLSATPSGMRTPAGGDTPLPTVGIRSGGPASSPEQAREEAFQLAILSRKFLSKKVPPIALKDYIQRLHKYCPMSTAVFLAASVYISRMVLEEKLLRVTPKNMHRLVLAGLYVATKALEDSSYSHSRVAKVGGVSEQELSKLEITFCFLADFELRVDAQMLMEEVKLLSQPADLSNS
ncbi:hypothetical protein N7468_005706 [Penicillium chermesinum]|uniref:Cyclin n=1 Tax=Penicillium chermesinum TaxID=63820 RepID=A0A9W9TN84_9EURO|nr:uncharacterized protein N7468_005706 [Penicillium chermesinum]KAJ5232750.1 hypothetical protein N7468_005706 [Penicillium chermesinum]KAJ6172409.1 hypothetical protein N7470_001476 [Penicillium chermesinum]